MQKNVTDSFLLDHLPPNRSWEERKEVCVTSAGKWLSLIAEY